MIHSPNFFPQLVILVFSQKFLLYSVEILQQEFKCGLQAASQGVFPGEKESMLSGGELCSNRVSPAPAAPKRRVSSPGDE